PALRIGKRYYLSGLAARLKKHPRPSPKPKCVALRSHLRILPDGKAPACRFHTEAVGDLLRQSLEEPWYGASARATRPRVDPCPGCWAECEVIPSAVYTGDIVRGILPVTVP